MAGQGNITLISHLLPAGGGGVAGAQNGLSLVGANVELGGANPLLHNTDILLGGFSYRIIEGAGDVRFLLDNFLRLYGLGDISGAFNQTSLGIDDINQTILLAAGPGLGAALSIDGVNNTITGITNGFQTFQLDSITGLYRMGDIPGAVNGTRLIINDANQIIQFDIATFPRLVMDAVNQNYQFGDIAAAGNGLIIELDDSSNLLRVIGAGGQSFMLLNGAAGTFAIGDVTNLFNGGKIIVNDTANVLQINNSANTLGININGVAGFTGTVTPVTTITVNNGIVTNVA